MDNRPEAGTDPVPEDGEFVTARTLEQHYATKLLPTVNDPIGGQTEGDRGAAVDGKSTTMNPVSFLSPGFSNPEANRPGFRHVTALDPDGPEESLRRQTAVAGAVTAVFLGVWSIIFSYFTGLAIINALIGIAFAVWGLTSTRYSLAIVGLVLCTAGFLMTMIFAAQ